MSQPLPDEAFEGLGGIGDDHWFDRSARASLVFSGGRGQAWDSTDGAEMGNVLSTLWGGVKKVTGAVAKPLTSAVQATGKGVINAVGARFGLGPIFKDGQPPPPGAPQPFNYKPLLIGGGIGLAALTILIVATRRK